MHDFFQYRQVTSADPDLLEAVIRAVHDARRIFISWNPDGLPGAFSLRISLEDNAWAARAAFRLDAGKVAMIGAVPHTPDDLDLLDDLFGGDESAVAAAAEDITDAYHSEWVVVDSADGFIPQGLVFQRSHAPCH